MLLLTKPEGRSQILAGGGLGRRGQGLILRMQETFTENKTEGEGDQLWKKKKKKNPTVLVEPFIIVTVTIHHQAIPRTAFRLQRELLYPNFFTTFERTAIEIKFSA